MYKAKVIQANDIIKHPNADNLNLLRYNGEQFVVGKDIKSGDVVILFPTDGQLSHEFCSANNLYRNSEMNSDKTKSGFFEETRRVRAQPFRGQKSYGFVCTEKSFVFLGKVALNVGDEFDTLNGVLICSKYYTPKTLRVMKANQSKKTKDVEYTMKEHIDTEKWSYTKPTGLFEPSLVIITEKVHGTSARTSNTKVIHRNPYWWQKALNRVLGKEFEMSKYELVTGTRRTIVNNRLDVISEGQQDHYRWDWHNKISPQLKVGETIYYEIVGWDSFGGTIMDKQDLKKVKKENLVSKSWNSPMVYSYGLPEGQNDVYLYRITMTTDDGSETELSWYQVEQRCRELGLKPVPVLQKELTSDVVKIDNWVESFMTDSSSFLDERHLMEGVCIRIENSEGVKIYKQKNFIFGVLEGYLKEDESYVDTEEVN